MTVAAILFAGDSPIDVSVMPPNAYASAFGNKSATTNSVTVTASGGSGALSAAWTHIDGDVVTINSPSAFSTTFTGTPGLGNSLYGTYRCTVSDPSGHSNYVDVTVSIEESSYF